MPFSQCVDMHTLSTEKDKLEDNTFVSDMESENN